MHTVKRLLLLGFLLCLPWLTIINFNVGMNAANAIFQKPMEWAFHAETVWQVTAVWAIAVIAAWVVLYLWNAIHRAVRPNETS